MQEMVQHGQEPDGNRPESAGVANDTGTNEDKAASQAAEHGTKLKDLGTMAAGLAHEINNPLNYAILGVELLKREGRDMLARITIP